MRYEPRDLAGRVNCFWNHVIVPVPVYPFDEEWKNGIKVKGRVQKLWNKFGKNASKRTRISTMVVVRDIC